jgi:formate-dependent nitrite reductase cytochrome c552 subunit
MIRRNWFKSLRSLPGWLIVAPSLLIIALMVLFTPATNASPAPATLTGVVPQAQAQTPVCQSCHPQEYEAWKNTPHAQAANVSCEACHGQYKPNHPDSTTMQLPMASDTCQTCHAATFSEWKDSQHADKNIECFDCHNAHTQGLRTGSEEKLCGACHSERQTQVAHATHGINGVNCANCHMAPENTGNGDAKLATDKPTQGSVRSHTFRVSSDVCAKCHESTIHTSNQVAELRQTVTKLDPAGAQQQADRVPAMEKQITDLQARVNSMRSAAALTMGLAFGFGGFLGLVFGIVGMALWQRRNP